jgi:hypothetical protein
MAVRVEVSALVAQYRTGVWVSVGASAGLGALSAALLGSIAFDLGKRPEGLSSTAFAFLFLLALLLFVFPPVLSLVLSSPLRKALRELRGRQLWFAADENGLTVPFVLLTDPAYSRVLKAGMTDVFIPWKDITSWKAKESSLVLQAHYRLEVAGESASLGERAPGQGPLWIRNGFGIWRQPMVNEEKDLLALVDSRLGVRERLSAG